MIKIDQKKSLTAVFTGLFVIASVFSPLVATAQAATMNGGSQPYQLLRVGRGSDAGTTNWNNNSVSVEVDEGVSFVVFFNNSSSETAQDVNVYLDVDVAGNGQSISATAYLRADNASTITDSVTVNLTGPGSFTNLKHLDTERFDYTGTNSVSLGGSETAILSSSGLDLGNIAPGNSNAGFVVVDFNAEGETNNSGNRPDVKTLSPTNVDENSARFRCEVDPNGEDTDVWFEWGEGDSVGDLDFTTNTGDIDSTEGFTTVYHTENGLDEDTEYVYRCVAESSEGKTNGSIKTFTTDDDGGSNNNDDLEVTTLSATDIDEDSAELRCDVDTGDEDADVWFEWGEDDDDLDEDTSKTSVGDNRSNVRVTRTISNLDEDERYYFRCVAEDDDGNEDEGSIRSFTTDRDGGGSDDGDEPTVTTLAATGVDNTSATLRCEVDPNGEDTDAWFEWGTSSSNLNRDTSSVDLGSGTSDVIHASRITGLVTNTTYFYRCLAENSEGDDAGSVRSFVTTTPNIITRFIDIFREVPVEVEAEPLEEALIITLNADSVDTDNRVIEYLVSYDNRTRLFLTDAELTVELPNELSFIDSRPNSSRESRDEIFFNIGRIEAGEQGSFLIETEVDRDVDANDLIRLVAHVEYNDDGSARKIVEVINESTYGELIRGAGGFTANILSALRDFFTSPILWLLLFIALIVFVARYLFAARSRRDTSLV